MTPFKHMTPAELELLMTPFKHMTPAELELEIANVERFLRIRPLGNLELRRRLLRRLDAARAEREKRGGELRSEK